MLQSRTVKVLAALLLLDFFAINVYALYSVGGQAALDMVANSSPWMWVTFADLYIMLMLVSGYMWRDARQRGANPAGYVIATMLTGCIAPLIYLVHRPGNEHHTS